MDLGSGLKGSSWFAVSDDLEESDFNLIRFISLAFNLANFYCPPKFKKPQERGNNQAGKILLRYILRRTYLLHLWFPIFNGQLNYPPKVIFLSLVITITFLYQFKFD